MFRKSGYPGMGVRSWDLRVRNRILRRSHPQLEPSLPLEPPAPAAPTAPATKKAPAAPVAPVAPAALEAKNQLQPPPAAVEAKNPLLHHPNASSPLHNHHRKKPKKA